MVSHSNPICLPLFQKPYLELGLKVLVVQAMPRPKSLLDYLTKPNPPLTLEQRPSSKSAKGTNTTHCEYPTPVEVRPWKEFKMGVILKLYGEQVAEVLKRQRSTLSDIPVMLESQLVVKLEPSMTSIVNTTNLAVVLNALQHSAHSLVSQNVRMHTGDRARVLDGQWRPDWAGMSDVQGLNNILPGDTKTSRTWGSEMILKYVVNKKIVTDGEKNLWPLRQLLCYCICCHARYGYIITDKELLVMRVGTREEKGRETQPSQKELRDAVHDNAWMEWKAISWNAYGSKKMTINLALWALHIMAANNGLLDWTYDSLNEEAIVDLDTQRGRVLIPDNPSFVSNPEADLATSFTSETVEAQSFSQTDQPTMSFDSHELHSQSFTSIASIISIGGAKRKRSTRDLRPRKRTL